jgi:hypothetical protein
MNGMTDASIRRVPFSLTPRGAANRLEFRTPTAETTPFDDPIPRGLVLIGGFACEPTPPGTQLFTGTVYHRVANERTTHTAGLPGLAPQDIKWRVHHFYERLE